MSESTSAPSNDVGLRSFPFPCRPVLNIRAQRKVCPCRQAARCYWAPDTDRFRRTDGPSLAGSSQWRSPAYTRDTESPDGPCSHPRIRHPLSMSVRTYPRRSPAKIRNDAGLAAPPNHPCFSAFCAENISPRLASSSLVSSIHTRQPAPPSPCACTAGSSHARICGPPFWVAIRYSWPLLIACQAYASAIVFKVWIVNDISQPRRHRHRSRNGMAAYLHRESVHSYHPPVAPFSLCVFLDTRGRANRYVSVGHAHQVDEATVIRNIQSRSIAANHCNSPGHAKSALIDSIAASRTGRAINAARHGSSLSTQARWHVRNSVSSDGRTCTPSRPGHHTVPVLAPDDGADLYVAHWPPTN